MKKRPIIITLIGDAHILSAFLLILSLLPVLKLYGINVYSLPDFFKVPIYIKNILILIEAILILFISYSFLKLRIWGYWLMISYNIFILFGWIITYQQYKQHFFPLNIIMIIIGLIYTVPTYKYFKKLVL